MSKGTGQAQTRFGDQRQRISALQHGQFRHDRNNKELAVKDIRAAKQRDRQERRERGRVNFAY